MRATPNTVLRGLSITSAIALLALVASLPLGMTGCNNEGEGERCTLFSNSGDAGENGTDECSAGLLCVSAAGAYPGEVAATTGVGKLGICCPPSGTPSTAAACMAMVGGSTLGGPPVGDGGYDADSAVDAHKAPDGSADAKHTADAHASDAASKDAGHASHDAGHDATTGG